MIMANCKSCGGASLAIWSTEIMEKRAKAKKAKKEAEKKAAAKMAKAVKE
jgi:CO dehydrogenase/acetyl-CoA synthase gamma subunit (corrinoid Fe-S protein)